MEYGLMIMLRVCHHVDAFWWWFGCTLKMKWMSCQVLCIYLYFLQTETPSLLFIVGSLQVLEGSQSFWQTVAAECLPGSERLLQLFRRSLMLWHVWDCNKESWSVGLVLSGMHSILSFVTQWGFLDYRWWELPCQYVGPDINWWGCTSISKDSACLYTALNRTQVFENKKKKLDLELKINGIAITLHRQYQGQVIFSDVL